jgi:hypothetical protein
MDLFLAHKVIAPVLYQYREDIILWRFHRRAVRDQSGHNFSFIFYASPETARRIYNTLKADPHLKAMKSTKMIVDDAYDDTSRVTKPNIEDTSDRNWSLPVQKSWPHFIMGVSQMWLDLITEIAGQTTEKGLSSPREIEAFYQQVNQSVLESWQEEGRHALLHHLNALFGYEPVIVYEKRLLRF